MSAPEALLAAVAVMVNEVRERMKSFAAVSSMQAVPS